jgi:Rod binding domain-containing protein
MQSKTEGIAGLNLAGPTHTANRTPVPRKLERAARQFEAMFMTEMLRQARPQNKAAGAFAEGDGERTWSMFMDQALGEASVAKQGTGLLREIERAMQGGRGPSGAR